MAELTWNDLTGEQKELFGVYQLCRRLLEINPAHDKELGCPAEYVAFPVLMGWLDSRGFVGDRRHHAPDVVRRMLSAEGQGRTCEIYEIQYSARKFVDEFPPDLLAQALS